MQMRSLMSSRPRFASCTLQFALHATASAVFVERGREHRRDGRASRVSMSRRCSMNTSLPSRRSATDGDEGGYGAKSARARSVASMSAPANTVATTSGRCSCCSAMAMPGRALPAAHPHTELTTIITVPCSRKAASTSSGVRNWHTRAHISQLGPHRGNERLWIRHSLIVVVSVLDSVETDDGAYRQRRWLYVGTPRGTAIQSPGQGFARRPRGQVRTDPAGRHRSYPLPCVCSGKCVPGG